ncbi:MAG: hypothetical protein US50_C0052G0016 [Candidatus Nomurabacteria bacterium GW2011_GWB1_37_5]|uniref:Uncharacterized protein n=1 Tax=Candidatus Nomurabacteria bacterium GW2011_GWB1_37_5 TaxID=1618742 RepID=A0A0G0H725_9BACT|nr:MAG: hypothetical protein US50_C0052G0016 [Candidatus Nomurabacteria bacterium GW2011_GWB1_37_5]
MEKKSPTIAISRPPTSAQMNDLVKEVEKDALVEVLEVSGWMKQVFIPSLIRKILLDESVENLLNSSRVGTNTTMQISLENIKEIIKVAGKQKYKDKLAEIVKNNEKKVLVKNISKVTQYNEGSEGNLGIEKKSRPVLRSEVPDTPSVLPYELNDEEPKQEKKQPSINISNKKGIPYIAEAPTKMPKIPQEKPSKMVFSVSRPSDKLLAELKKQKERFAWPNKDSHNVFFKEKKPQVSVISNLSKENDNKLDISSEIKEGSRFEFKGKKGTVVYVLGKIAKKITQGDMTIPYTLIDPSGKYEKKEGNVKLSELKKMIINKVVKPISGGIKEEKKEKEKSVNSEVSASEKKYSNEKEIQNEIKKKLDDKKVIKGYLQKASEKGNKVLESNLSQKVTQINKEIKELQNKLPKNSKKK